MARQSAAHQVPPALLKVKGLGGPRQYFPQRQQQNQLLEVAAWGAFLVSAVIVGYASLRAYQQWTHFGVAASVWAVQWLTLAGGLFLASIVVLWLMRKRRSAGGVMVYQQGLAIDAPGGLRKWPWEAWVSLTVDSQQQKFLGMARAKQLRYRLVDDLGKVLVLDESLVGIQDLGRLLEQNILPHLLSAAEQKYRAGEALQFGPLQIQRDRGLFFGKQQVPWAAVRLLAVKDGYLEIQLKQDDPIETHFPAAQVPNLPVLLALSGGHPGVRVQTSTPA